MKTKNAVTSAERKAFIARRRVEHHKALEALYQGFPVPSGEKLWRALRRIEVKASNAATAQCNGEAYQGQPYREESEWNEFCSAIGREVARVMGGTPEGFYVNGDPRGYALKIDPERGGRIPAGLETDWGRYGLLAPIID
jgi:hypothetical protein